MRRFFSLILACAIPLLGACGQDPEAAKAAHLQSGDKFFAEKKFREASIEYRNAVQADPKFADARRKLAETYLELNEGENALREYVRAADLLPGDADVQIRAGRLLMMAGLFRDARARAEQALKVDSKNAEAHILLGNVLAGLKDDEGAVEAIETGIQLDPKKARGYLELGELQLNRGASDAAEDAFKTAVEVAPESVSARLSLTNFYLAAGRRPDAKRALDEGLALEPESPIFNQALAIFYLQGNDFEGAKPYLDASNRLAKNNLAVQFELADFFLRSGRTDAAVEELARITPADSDFATLRLKLASIHLAAKRPADAYKVVEDLLKREPRNVEGLVLKARLLGADRKFEEALVAANAALAADARVADAHYVSGTIHLGLNKLDDARKAFAEVLRLNPGNSPAQLQLSRLEFSQGRLDAAVEYAQQAVNSQPNNVDARLALAKAFIGRQDFGRAEAELVQLTASFPKVPAVHVQAGVLSLMRGNTAAARRSFERTLTLDRDNVEAIKGLVVLDLATRNTTGAEARIKAALDKNPSRADLLMTAANVYAATGDARQVEDSLRKAVDAEPSNLRAYQSLGEFYANQGRLKEAEEQFERLVARQPDSVSAHTMAAILAHLQNDTARAQKRYEAILQIDPRAPIAANNLAYLQAENGGNLDVALQLAQTAKSQLPDDPEVNDTLGWVYYKKDLATLAISALELSVAKEPRNQLYQYHLGLAYAKAGDSTKARQFLEEAIKLNPEAAESAEAKKALAALKG